MQIVLLAHVDAWIATVVTCLKKRTGPNHKKLYADTNERELYVAKEQDSDRIGQFVEYWATDEILSGRVYW